MTITIDQLIQVLMREETDDAGMRAVVKALRDEMQVHCHTHGEPECCGRGVPNYNNTAEECCCVPDMKVTDEIVIGLFNEILAPREGGNGAAGVTALEAVGAGLSPASGQAPAAPAPAVFFSKEPPLWALDPYNPGLTATCGSCGAWLTVVRPGKHQCDNPNCPTEAQR